MPQHPLITLQKKSNEIKAMSSVHQRPPLEALDLAFHLQAVKPRVWAPRIIRGTRLANQYANLGLGRAKECSRGSDPESELETRERTQDEGEMREAVQKHSVC